jgi:Transposase and inactivated derivatives
MDNLCAHRVNGAEQIAKSVGATISYPPPYSPDINSIGQMWSRIKAFLRSIKTRTLESLLSAILSLFLLFLSLILRNGLHVPIICGNLFNCYKYKTALIKSRLEILLTNIVPCCF